MPPQIDLAPLPRTAPPGRRVHVLLDPLSVARLEVLRAASGASNSAIIRAAIDVLADRMNEGTR